VIVRGILRLPSLPFWQNLKTGYDLFEKDRVPPNASVKDRQYAFE